MRRRSRLRGRNGLPMKIFKPILSLILVVGLMPTLAFAEANSPNTQNVATSATASFSTEAESQNQAQNTAAAQQTELQNAEGEKTETAELAPKPEPAAQETVASEEAAEATPAAEAFSAEQEVDGVIVAVSADAGVLPAGATLRVTALDNEAKSQANDAVAKMREKGAHVAAAFQYDVKVLDASGAEVQPDNSKGEVKVSFTIKGQKAQMALDANVYHIADNAAKADKLERATESGTASDTTVEAKTTGFSTYVVEFTYNDLRYVLQGGESVALADVLTQLGITGEASAHSVSNPELFDIADEGGAPTVTAKQAFSSEEWMKVTVDGIEYEIVVTDDQNSGLVDDSPLPGNSAQSSSMKFLPVNHYGACTDIRGIFNGKEIKTTYGNQGYIGNIKVDNGNAAYMNIGQLGKVYDFSGVQVKQNVSLVDSGEVVKFSYTLCNPSDTAKTVNIGACTDVQIGDNDYATVYVTNGGQTISMTDTHTGSCTSAGLKYTITADEDTPFSGAWIGGYWDAYDSVFSTSPDGSSYNGDSGCAFHWTMALAPGQTATKTCYFQIAPALVIEDVHLTADAENGKVKFDIPFKDFKNRSQTLYYTLEGMSQATQAANTNDLPTDSEGFAHQSFQFEADASSWPPNTMRTITLYATDSVGYKSKTYTFNVWWPAYNPGATYYTVKFENTVKGFADVRNEPGKTITLPADDSGDSKKVFSSWNTAADGTGTTYLAGSTYTIPSEDSVLYAQWKLDISVLTFVAEDATYTGQPIESVKVKYGTKTLTPGVDYTVTYENNVNVGTATATIGGDKLQGSKVLNFNIVKANLENVSVAQTDTLTYSGSAQQAQVSAAATAKGNQPVTFKYYKDGDDAASATTDVPSYTEAGAHAVHYIASAPNHNDSTGTFNITIGAKDMASPDITIDDIADQVYNSIAITPGISAKDGSKNLVLGTDYDVSYSNNVNAGTATITVTGKGNYSGTATKTFVINKRTVGLSWGETEHAYTATQWAPAVAATNLAGADTCSVILSNDSYGVNAGSYTATAASLSNSNYALPAEVTKAFTIKPADLSSVTVASIPGQTYSGEPKKPAIIATLGAYQLTSDDFRVVYDNNVSVGTASALLFPKVGGSGNFTNYKEVTFGIGKRDAQATATDRVITYNGVYDIEAAAENLFTKDPEAGQASYSLIDGGTGAGVINAGKLTPSKAGTFKIKMHTEEAANVKAGDFVATLTINPKAVTVTADSKTKTYGEADPALTATVEGLLAGESASLITYSLSRTAGEAAGSYDITPTGVVAQGNYAVAFVGSKLTVKKRDAQISGTDRAITYNGAYDIEAASEKLFTTDAEAGAATYAIAGGTGEGSISGSNLTVTKPGSFIIKMSVAEAANVKAGSATAILTVNAKAVTVTADDKTKTYKDEDPQLTATVNGLVAGESESLISYFLSRAAGEDAGSYAITASGAAEQGNYIVSYASGNLTIEQADLGNVTIASIPDQTYTGASIEPSVAAKLGSYDLTSSDFTVSYDSNKDVGTANAALSPVAGGNFKGSASATFQILQKAVTVTADAKSKVFGEADPALTATVEGLVDGESASQLIYTVTRETGETAGTYAITAAGDASQGNYAVAFAGNTLTIEPVKAKDLSVNVKDGGNVVFNGSPEKPSIVIKDGDIELVEGVDYDVTGNEGTKIGEYSMTIAFKGNYSGEQKVTWTIVAPKHEDQPSGGKEQTPENKQALDKTYDSVMKEISETGKVPSNITEATPGAVQAAIAAGDGLIIEVKTVQVAKIDEASVPAEDKASIEAAVASIADANQPTNVVKYLDIDVLLKNARTGETLANITKTDEPISLSINLDDETLEKMKDVTVYLVRIHDGEATFLPATLDGNTLTFSSDLFSTYALATVAGPIANAPAVDLAQTGDRAPLAPIAAAGLAALIALGAITIARRKHS